ncbi:MAG: DUF547 domain-containing protein [Zetaproteobacteria bacterium]|nr:DUF547 domain-containing protein [Zetaproteobacteria bacterium]
MRCLTCGLWILSWSLVSGFGVAGQVKVDVWNQLLKKHLNASGRVSYLGVQQDVDTLGKFLKSYRQVDPAAWDDATKKAHYINLYNAVMMWNILRYVKHEKIKVTSSAFTKLKVNKIKVDGGNIWNGDYRVHLGGEKLNLDQIEHGLIRGDKAQDVPDRWRVQQLDPRIHAAVNCAALSCPPVAAVAYTPAAVDKMLEESFSRFLQNPKQFSMIGKDKMKANKILLWYYSDFDTYAQQSLNLKGAGDYLQRFLSNQPAHKSHIAHFKQTFNDRSSLALRLSRAYDFHYNWQINDQRND